MQRYSTYAQVNSPCPSSLKTNSLFSDSFSFFPRRRFFPPLPVNKPKLCSVKSVAIFNLDYFPISQFNRSRSDMHTLTSDARTVPRCLICNREIRKWEYARLACAAATLLACLINQITQKCQIYWESLLRFTHYNTMWRIN